jgi:hypothetical protein
MPINHVLDQLAAYLASAKNTLCYICRPDDQTITSDQYKFVSCHKKLKLSSILRYGAKETRLVWFDLIIRFAIREVHSEAETVDCRNVTIAFHTSRAAHTTVATSTSHHT